MFKMKKQHFLKLAAQANTQSTAMDIINVHPPWLENNLDMISGCATYLPAVSRGVKISQDPF